MNQDPTAINMLRQDLRKVCKAAAERIPVLLGEPPHLREARVTDIGWCLFHQLEALLPHHDQLQPAQRFLRNGVGRPAPDPIRIYQYLGRVLAEHGVKIDLAHRLPLAVQPLWDRLQAVEKSVVLTAWPQLQTFHGRPTEDVSQIPDREFGRIGTRALHLLCGETPPPGLA